MVVMMVHIEGSGGREQEKEKRNGKKMKLKSRSQFRHNLHGISKMQLA